MPTGKPSDAPKPQKSAPRKAIGVVGPKMKSTRPTRLTAASARTTGTRPNLSSRAGPNPATAFAGALLWGLGASLGFPVGMSAAADDPAKAAGRVSVVASIGYCAFLGGPPLIGFLGDHVTVLKGLAAVVVLLAVATAAAGAIRPLEPAQAPK